MKTLAGQELTDGDYAELLKEIDALVWKLVYRPVVDLVRPTLPRVLQSAIAPRTMLEATHGELLNAMEREAESALKKALQTGAVQIVPDPKGERAQFAVAKPDRRISDALKAFGCQRSKATDLWTCAPEKVPNWVLVEARGYFVKARAGHDSVKGLLKDLEGRIDEAVDKASLGKGIQHAVGKVAEGWLASAKALEVMPDLGATGEAALRAAFEANARIPIKRMAKEMVARLRAEVDENASRGYRAEGLATRIRNEYAVSKTRADLIARQETSNFMAAYRQARATDAGLKRYVWTTSRDIRVRPGHKQLNGQKFYYATKAPGRYMSTGEPCNPGEDFRCRCVDRPIIE